MLKLSSSAHSNTMKLEKTRKDGPLKTWV